MNNELVIIEEKHKKAARTIVEKMISELTPKYLVTISGEVGTGKASIALCIAKILKKGGISSKTIKMDNYYKIPPKERTKWRKEHGIQAVGSNEYDWDRINQVIKNFRNDEKAVLPFVDLITGQVDELHTDFKDIDVLIIDGLYSIKLDESNLKVFIELTYEDSREFQLFSEQEVLNEFRMQVLEREHKVVQALKPKADFYVDFDSSLEIFHL